MPSLTLDPQALRGAATQAVGVLKLLANEDRLLLLCQLSQGEQCVSELEAALSDMNMSSTLDHGRHSGCAGLRG